MKFLYTSDLHGYDPFYREILSVCQTQNISAVILGGDLFPRKGHTNNSLNQQKDYIHNNFRPFLQEIKEINGTLLYCILGNDDFAGTIPLMEEMEKENLLTFLHNRTVLLNEDIVIAGYSYIPPTPFPVKDFEKRDREGNDDIGENPHAYISRDNKIVQMKAAEWLFQQNTIEEDMKKFVTEVKPNRKLIHVIHTPPYDTLLDCLYDGRSIGSKAVRRYIEENQPMMTLHGHIHESPDISGHYWQKLGSTLSINPGQNTRQFSAVLCDLSASTRSVSHTIFGTPSETL
jgi:Icc-related predicted phosphoesterase